jgi:hypothetical protein
MITLVFKRNFGFKDGSFFLRGEEGDFNNNEAHSLIERGVAVVKKSMYKPPKDKMFRSKQVKKK